MKHILWEILFGVSWRKDRSVFGNYNGEKLHEIRDSYFDIFRKRDVELKIFLNFTQ